MHQTRQLSHRLIGSRISDHQLQSVTLDCLFRISLGKRQDIISINRLHLSCSLAVHSLTAETHLAILGAQNEKRLSDQRVKVGRATGPLFLIPFLQNN